MIDSGSYDALEQGIFRINLRLPFCWERRVLALWKMESQTNSVQPILKEWFVPGIEFFAPVPSHTEGSLALVIGDLSFIGDLIREVCDSACFFRLRSTKEVLTHRN